MEKDLYPQDNSNLRRPEAKRPAQYPRPLLEGVITWRDGKVETPMRHQVINGEDSPADPDKHSPADPGLGNRLGNILGSSAAEELQADLGHSHEQVAGDNQPSQELDSRELPKMPIEHPLSSVSNLESRPGTFNVITGLDYIARKRAERASMRNAAEQELIDQQLALHPTQHLERSSWHSYVVDDRGHEVKEAINYGDAFKQERQKEFMAAPPAAVASSTDDTTDNTAQGQLPTLPDSHYLANELPSGMTDPALPSGIEAQEPRLEASTKPASSNKGSDGLWFWVTAFFVVVVVALVLLT